MKKIVQSRIFLIVICGIFFTSVGVYAATIYQASDISYSPTDSSWEVNNVNDAINSLYESINSNTNSTITFFNNGAQYTAVGQEETIDLKSYSNYENLVLNENLFLVLSNGASIVSHYDYNRTSVTSNLEYSYDAATGILTYSIKLNGTTLSMNYYNDVQFKILIIE